MNRLVAPLLAASLGALAVLAPRPAHALGPIGVEVAVKVGAGSDPGVNGYPNPYGFGLGGRAGITLLGFYAGANVVNYFGSSDTVGVGPASAELKWHALLYGGEVGWGLTLADLVTIRAQVGLGSANFMRSGTVGVSGVGSASAVDDSQGHFYVEPGLTGLIWLGKFFVGVDWNYLLVPNVETGSAANNGIVDTSKSLSATTIHGQIGVGF